MCLGARKAWKTWHLIYVEKIEERRRDERLSIDGRQKDAFNTWDARSSNTASLLGNELQGTNSVLSEARGYQLRSMICEYFTMQGSSLRDECPSMQCNIDEEGSDQHQPTRGKSPFHPLIHSDSPTIDNELCSE